MISSLPLSIAYSIQNAPIKAEVAFYCTYCLAKIYIIDYSHQFLICREIFYQNSSF